MAFRDRRDLALWAKADGLIIAPEILQKKVLIWSAGFLSHNEKRPDLAMNRTWSL